SKPFSAGVLLARCASLIANRRLIKQRWANGDAPAAHAAPESASATSEAQPARPTPPAGDIDNEFYARFLEIFTPDMGNPDLSVETLASRMGLERTQFYRKIKAITNYSPVELVRNLRLKQGRHMLKTTDRSISEIAYATGFSTPAYFTKCYRTAYGETPSETRSAIGK
ncbi:MAG: helix-turn-helix transcriptional regulator, partial [Muribaculaceae bacterium]|nr:helix-turn-helix transcriptional regulator [Muribaculaceae bacterium]